MSCHSFRVWLIGDVRGRDGATVRKCKILQVTVCSRYCTALNQKSDDQIVLFTHHRRRTAMDRLSGKIAIVTGASAGIGSAIVRRLVENEMVVVGFARNIDKMKELKEDLKGLSGTFYPLKVDITKDEEIKEAFSWIEVNLKAVHVLVNNAGCMAIGKLTEGEGEVWRYTFELNVVAAILCAKEAIRLMQVTNVAEGVVINMNSTAGHQVPFYSNPRLNVYPASKFALTAICQTLRQELRFSGSTIRVSSVSPGYVDTGFALKARNADKIAGEIEMILEAQPSLKAEDVAAAVLHIISMPRHVQVDEIVLTAV